MTAPTKTFVIACPKCQHSTIYGEKNPFRPFCSQSCKDGDTIAWIEESYRVPSPPATEEEVEIILSHLESDL